jgi:hypothetical protein
MIIAKETASEEFVNSNSKEPDWCDKETLAEIKKKFNKDGKVLSQKQISKLIEENDLTLKRLLNHKS